MNIILISLIVLGTIGIIDAIINTKSANSNVVKGSQVS